MALWKFYLAEHVPLFKKWKKVEDVQALVKLPNLFLSLSAMIGHKSDKKAWFIDMYL